MRPRPDNIRFVTVVDKRQAKIETVHPQRDTAGDNREREPNVRRQKSGGQFLITVIDDW